MAASSARSPSSASWCIVVAFLAYNFFTFRVQPDEVGVVLFFGKYDRDAPPGLNFRLPYPIETVYTPRVTRVNRVTIGQFADDRNDRHRRPRHPRREPDAHRRREHRRHRFLGLLGHQRRRRLPVQHGRPRGHGEGRRRERHARGRRPLQHPAAPHPGAPDHRDRRAEADPGHHGQVPAPAFRSPRSSCSRSTRRARSSPRSATSRPPAPTRSASRTRPRPTPTGSSRRRAARPRRSPRRRSPTATASSTRRRARPTASARCYESYKASPDVTRQAHVSRDAGGGLLDHGQGHHRRERPAATASCPTCRSTSSTGVGTPRRDGRRHNEARHLRRRRPHHPGGDRDRRLPASSSSARPSRRWCCASARSCARSTEPGLYYKLPLIDNVVYFDKRILDLDSPPLEIIASDQKRLVVDAFGRYKIINPLLFYQSVGSIEVADSAALGPSQLGRPRGARRRHLHPARPRRARRPDVAHHRRVDREAREPRHRGGGREDPAGRPAGGQQPGDLPADADRASAGSDARSAPRASSRRAASAPRPTAPRPSSSPRRRSSRSRPAVDGEAEQQPHLSPRPSTPIRTSSPSTGRCRPIRRASAAADTRWVISAGFGVLPVLQQSRHALAAPAGLARDHRPRRRRPASEAGPGRAASTGRGNGRRPTRRPRPHRRSPLPRRHRPRPAGTRRRHRRRRSPKRRPAIPSRSSEVNGRRRSGISAVAISP